MFLFLAFCVVKMMGNFCLQKTKQKKDYSFIISHYSYVYLRRDNQNIVDVLKKSEATVRRWFL